jgi:uncharacterized protein YjbI with pentapeptide repeats
MSPTTRKCESGKTNLLSMWYPDDISNKNISNENISNKNISNENISNENISKIDIKRIYFEYIDISKE